MQPHQSRKFHAEGATWIARRVVPPLKDGGGTPIASNQRGKDPGIWFESTKGRFRFLRHAEDDGFPSDAEFMTMSGIQLARLLGRAVTK